MSATRSKADVIAAMYQASSRDDLEGMLELLAPDFELDVTDNVFNPAVWRGEAGAREWLHETREVWDLPDFELEGVEEIDAERALTAVVIEGTARLSGVRMPSRQWHVWTIRDGLVVRCAHYNDEATARREAGLSRPSG